MDTPIELQLKEFILSRYKSVREFSIVANIPTSTLATILERGIKNASINTVFRICDTLNIDIDSLMVNKILVKQVSKEALINKDNTIIAIGSCGKRVIYEMTSEQLQLIMDMANALTKNSDKQ